MTDLGSWPNLPTHKSILSKLHLPTPKHAKLNLLKELKYEILGIEAHEAVRLRRCGCQMLLKEPTRGRVGTRPYP